MKKLTMLLAAAMLAMSSTAFAASKAQAEKAIKEAHAANDAAKKQGFEWRDVRWKKSKKALLKQAEAALKKGNYNKAYKLAMEAKKHGELAQKQAKDQANAGPLF
jgi:hypothetical protein